MKVLLAVFLLVAAAAHLNSLQLPPPPCSPEACWDCYTEDWTEGGICAGISTSCDITVTICQCDYKQQLFAWHNVCSWEIEEEFAICDSWGGGCSS